MEQTQFTIRRMRATAGVEAKIQKMLFNAAKGIVTMSSRYRSGKRIVAEDKFIRDAQKLTASMVDGIENEIKRYAMASTDILGIATDNIEAFLKSNVYGTSSRERTEKYLQHFAEDIVRMAKAGISMGYTPQKIFSAVRSGYKKPYVTSIITKAERNDINIGTPSYGKGVFRSAYRNIVRNAKQMVAVAWGRAQQQYGKEKGAVAFRVFRASTFPCDVCDEQCAYIHSLQDPFPPFHVNCICGVQFIYNENNT